MIGWWVEVSPTNAIPFDVSPKEVVTWGVDGVGVVDFEDGTAVPPNTRLVFVWTSGSDPIVTDIVVGAVSGAQREIVGFVTSPAGDAIGPQRSPFTAGATNLTEVGWTMEVVQWLSAVSAHASVTPGHFRFALTYLGMIGGGTFFASLKNLKHVFENELLLGSTVGRSIDWNSQYHDHAGGQHDGALLKADPATFPKWRLGFGDPDGINAIWIALHTHAEFPVPCVLRFSAKMVGFATNPVGTIHQAPVGTYTPLIGEYAMWEVRTQIDSGLDMLVGKIYMPKDKTKSLNATDLMALHQENFTQYPDTVGGTQLSDDPADVRYHDLWISDGTRRYEMLEWRITASHITPDPNHGWSVAQESGKLALVVGLPATTFENDVGRYVLCGLTYQRADTFEDLPFVSIASWAPTGASYDGPQWNGGLAGLYPFVMQERTLGWYIMHPYDTTGACCTYTASVAGTYRLVGDFARATTSLGGNGVAVSVSTATGLLFTATIPASSGSGVVVTAPFAGAGWQTFDVTVPLAAGDVVRFIVDGIAADTGFDTTAFRVSVSYVPTSVPAFTGWGGHRGTAGRDRAVRCPRCGGVVRENELVVDGVTHEKVCTRYGCYDPPTPTGNFRWPFRS